MKQETEKNICMKSIVSMYQSAADPSGQRSSGSTGNPSACLWRTWWCCRWNQSHTFGQQSWCGAGPAVYLCSTDRDTGLGWSRSDIKLLLELENLNVQTLKPTHRKVWCLNGCDIHISPTVQFVLPTSLTVPQSTAVVCWSRQYVFSVPWERMC